MHGYLEKYVGSCDNTYLLSHFSSSHIILQTPKRQFYCYSTFLVWKVRAEQLSWSLYLAVYIYAASTDPSRPSLSLLLSWHS